MGVCVADDDSNWWWIESKQMYAFQNMLRNSISRRLKITRSTHHCHAPVSSPTLSNRLFRSPTGNSSFQIKTDNNNNNDDGYESIFLRQRCRRRTPYHANSTQKMAWACASDGAMRRRGRETSVSFVHQMKNWIPLNMYEMCNRICMCL